MPHSTGARAADPDARAASFGAAVTMLYAGGTVGIAASRSSRASARRIGDDGLKPLTERDESDAKLSGRARGQQRVWSGTECSRYCVEDRPVEARGLLLALEGGVVGPERPARLARRRALPALV